jgi:hypothetical protein
MEMLERRILYAAGDLDLSWGSGGIVQQEVFVGVTNHISGVVVDQQGRTLVAGGAVRGDDVAGLWIGRYRQRRL